jgi:photosystem II stability/assembly factor-like uncharacterized protein
VGSLKAQWQIQQDTSFYGKYYQYYSSISFVSDSVGYLVGCSDVSAWNSVGLFKTTDSGSSWKHIHGTSGGGCQIPNSFLDDQTGYCMISFGTAQPNELRKTTDGGLSWHQPDTTGNLQLGTTFLNDNIYFVNTLLGFVSKNNNIYKTANGGKNWQTVNTSHFVSSFFFTSPQTGFASGNKIILRTSDGGNNWNAIDTNYSILSLFFPSPNIGYAAGTNGTILKTTNGGTSWSPLTVNAGSIAINSVFCPDNTNCYAVGEQGTILHTTDGGTTWTKQNSGVKVKLNSVSCTATECFAAGDTSVLLRTTMTGITGIKTSHKGTNEISIFPNPFSNEATIKMNLLSKSPVTLILYTLLGEEIETIYGSSDQEIRIKSEHLKNGLYFVHMIQDGKNILTRKLVRTD